MKVKTKNPIICGLDIGASKVCMAIARKHPEGGLELTGFGCAESHGLNRGVVVDLDGVARAIRKAADEAVKKAGMSPVWVRLGAGGDHFEGHNSRGAVTVAGDRQEVTCELVLQVIAAAQSIDVPPDREIRHVLNQEFFLDGQGGIKNPEGLSGSQLDVDVHIITCQKSLIQNLINAANRAELNIQRVIAQPLASAEAVLTRDEKELGAVMIDIGGGSTGIAVYKRDAVRFTKTLPVGGNNFTRDLAECLQTTLEDAERIKKASGTVLDEHVDGECSLRVPGIGTRSERNVTQKEVSEILNARAIELLELINDQIRAAGVSPLVAGAVLTGGGSRLAGIVDLAKTTLDMPVRQGMPMGIRVPGDELRHPEYAAAVGLTLFCAEGSQFGPRPKNIFDKFFSLLFMDR